MKKALCIITALICSSAMLGGCKDKDKKTYIDIDSSYQVLDSELAEKLAQTDDPLDTVITDFDASKSYDYGVPSGYGNLDFDDKKLYIFANVGYFGDENWDGQELISCTIDLQTGKATVLCSDPGCDHNDNTYPNCIYNMLDLQMYAEKVVDGEIWYIGKDENEHFTNICSMKDGKSAVLFENTYYTKFEEGALAGNKMNDEDDTYLYELREFCVDEENIYAVAPSYMFIIDRKTMKAGDIIDLGNDGEIFLHQIYDGKAYVTNDFKELFTVDLETGEIVKLADKMGYDLTIYNEKIYYSFVELGSPNRAYLWCADLDGKNAHKVRDGVFQYVIKDNKVFYVPYVDPYDGTSAENNSGLRCYDLETEQETVLYDGDDLGGLLYTAEHIDRIFADGFNEDNVSVIVSVRTDGSDLWKKTIDPRDGII